jgi:hypothetical protein
MIANSIDESRKTQAAIFARMIYRRPFVNGETSRFAKPLVSDGT